VYEARQDQVVWNFLRGTGHGEGDEEEQAEGDGVDAPLSYREVEYMRVQRGPVTLCDVVGVRSTGWHRDQGMDSLSAVTTQITSILTRKYHDNVHVPFCGLPTTS
jgi:hypothetical protein